MMASARSAPENRLLQGVIPMLLVLAALLLAAAAFLVGEVATLPARERQRLDPPRRRLRPDPPRRHRARAPALPRARGRPGIGLAGPDRAPAEPARDARSRSRAAARRRHGPHADADRVPRRQGRRRARRRLLRPRRSAAPLGGPTLGLLLALAFGGGRLHRSRLLRLDAGAPAPRGRSARSCPTRSTCSPSASRPASASTARSTKLTEHMEGPLAEEFALTLGEMRIGESRQDALKKLAERAGTPELASLHPRDHPGRPARHLARPDPARPGRRLAR